jgi:hypothetical protein
MARAGANGPHAPPLWGRRSTVATNRGHHATFRTSRVKHLCCAEATQRPIQHSIYNTATDGLDEFS